MKEEFSFKRVNSALYDEEMKSEDEKVKVNDQRHGSNGEKDNQIMSQSDSQKTRNNNILLKAINLESFREDKADLTQNPIFYPFCKPGYNLMYGSQHIYVFLRQFYTIYERLMKAKDIIDEKVNEDLRLPKNENLVRMA